MTLEALHRKTNRKTHSQHYLSFGIEGGSVRFYYNFTDRPELENTWVVRKGGDKDKEFKKITHDELAELFKVSTTQVKETFATMIGHGYRRFTHDHKRDYVDVLTNDTLMGRI